MGAKTSDQSSTQGPQLSVVLVHGVLMRAPAMWILAGLLQRHAIRAFCFDYRSTTRSFSEHARDLAVFCEQKLGANGPWNLIGHSLGGVVALETLRLTGHDGRLVALGSSFNGSKTGRTLAGYPLVGPFLRIHRPVWQAETDNTPLPTATVGVIAGTVGVGVGSIVPGLRLDQPHDGTVSVAETLLAGAEHRLMPVNHTGLVYSPSVAAACAYFLHNGRFAKP